MQVAKNLHMSEAARSDAAAIENSNPEIQKPEAQLEISEQQTVQMEDHQGVGKTYVNLSRKINYTSVQRLTQRCKVMSDIVMWNI